MIVAALAKFAVIKIHPKKFKIQFIHLRYKTKNSIEDPSIISQMARCVVDGMEYYHGERIFPDSDRCYKCLCGPGFNNQTSFAQNPYCMEMECNIELYQWDEIKTGCVPVYNKLTTPCCPYELKCRMLFIKLISDINKME